MSTMASQITSLKLLYSSVYSGADQRKHKSSASLAFVRGIHRWPVNSPHKGLVTRKAFSFDYVIIPQLYSEVIWASWRLRPPIVTVGESIGDPAPDNNWLNVFKSIINTSLSYSIAMIALCNIDRFIIYTSCFFFICGFAFPHWWRSINLWQCWIRWDKLSVVLAAPKYCSINTQYMVTASNGIISALLTLCEGKSPVTGEFPSQRSVTRIFDVFFDLRLNKRLNKESRRRWFEMSSRSLWRHCYWYHSLVQSPTNISSQSTHRAVWRRSNVILDCVISPVEEYANILH